MNTSSTRLISCIALCVCVAFSSCSDTPSNSDSTNTGTDTSNSADAGMLKFQGEIFSIPSPVQTAVLMQQAGAAFDKAQLNDLANRDKYASERKKSLNLGVYGADLAYLSNYSDPQLSQQYFDVMGKLASDLDILDKMDPGLVKRFRDNMENRDSLLTLNASFYREGDRYLKNSERHEVASMVLVGGWIEALHLACSAAKTNQQLRSKVGEQKSAIISLVKIMQHFTDEEAVAMTEKFQSLANVFEKMETNYTYLEPINDIENKITYLNSKTSVIVSDEQLNEVTGTVEEIRNSIIQ